MAIDIRTEVVIHAQPKKVWSILTDFENYKKWNPFIVSVKGKCYKGEKIEVNVQQAHNKQMSFKPTILLCNQDQELRWLGSFIIKGLFDGEHYFTLIDNNNGTTSFVHGEKFSGVLVALFGNTLLKNIEANFNSMNIALKEVFEQ